MDKPWIMDISSGVLKNAALTKQLIEAAKTIPVEGGLTTDIDLEPVSYDSLADDLGEFNPNNQVQKRLISQMRLLIARGIPMANPELRASTPMNFGRTKLIIWYDRGLEQYYRYWEDVIVESRPE